MSVELIKGNEKALCTQPFPYIYIYIYCGGGKPPSPYITEAQK